MRWLIILALMTFGGDVAGEERVFRVPFAQDPPMAVKRKMENAVKELSINAKGLLQETEEGLETLLKKAQGERNLAEANLIHVTLDLYKSWVLRGVFEEFVSSPVGRWSWGSQRWVELFEDGTCKASWHQSPSLWTQDRFGTIHMIVTEGRAVWSGKIDAANKKMVKDLKCQIDMPVLNRLR